MWKRLHSVAWAAGALGALLLPMCASAHPLDVAYLDLGVATSSALTLTVAVHPYQAFELVRKGEDERFDLKRLSASGELISAYVQSHVEVASGASPCEWDAGFAVTPPSDIEAVAEGVTVAGELKCPTSSQTVHISATFFYDRFPDQRNIIRLDLPDGFADRATLDLANKAADVDVSELLRPAPVPVSDLPPAGRSGGDLAALAVRALDPSLPWWQLSWLLLSAILIGALHALGPGHGKSLMAAAMIGQKPTLKKAFMLGGVMAGTHVSDVFVMAVLASVLTAGLPPGRFLAFLEYASAVALCVMGVIGLVRAAVTYRRIAKDPLWAELDDAHARAHAFGLPHTHAQEKAHFRKALWAGFLGSLAPCPTAWAIFTATLSIGRWGIGLALLIAFSLGLAATVIGLGCLMVLSTSFMLKKTPPKMTYFLPIVSSGLITVLGAWLLWRAF